MAMGFETKIDIADFRRLRKRLEALAAQPSVRDGIEQAGARYMAFAARQFDANSTGGGDWPGLSPATKRSRRGRVFSILKDTGLLRNSLSAARYETDKIRGGIKVGTGVEYARYHQDGAGNLPKREIIVDPDAGTEQKMSADIDRGIQRAVDAAGGAP